MAPQYPGAPVPWSRTALSRISNRTISVSASAPLNMIVVAVPGAEIGAYMIDGLGQICGYPICAGRVFVTIAARDQDRPAPCLVAGGNVGAAVADHDAG